jgi:hypothetical protein
MDASPTPRQTIRLLLEIKPTTDGRLEGRMRADGTDPWQPFSGVLELLKALAELREERHEPDHRPFPV